MQDWNIRDVEREFLEFLRKLGIEPDTGQNLVFDGKKHRYRIFEDKARELNGEYRIYLDEWPAGYAKSYSVKHGVEYKTWSFSSGGMEFSEEERRAFREKREAEVRRRTEEENIRRNKAAINAAKIWENATSEGIDEMPYIVKKGITNVSGLRRLGSDIVTPLTDATGKIHSIQKIYANGDKWFLPGGRKRGCFYRLDGDVSKHLFICEGVATGLTIREATGCAVIVAFDAGNLQPVIESLSDASNLVLCADNDKKTNGNPGLNAALTAAGDYLIPIVLPEFEKASDGSDWNDYTAIHGIERTAEVIYSQIEEYYAAPKILTSFWWPETRELKSGEERPMATIANLSYLLKYHGYKIRYNEISRDIEIDVPNRKYNPDNKRNASFSDIESMLARSGLRLDRQILGGYLLSIADANSYNPAKEFIRREKWFGEDAIKKLAETLKFQHSYAPEWGETLLRKWLISAVAAAFSRGADDLKRFWTRGVLVLLGPQAIGKTSWLRRLCPPVLFSEGISLKLDNKDDVKRAISTWITEFGELDGTFKKSDMAQLKAFISNQYDELRLPFAKSAEKYVRRTVFAASVNRHDILQDDTGSSRWWIVSVSDCNARHSLNIGQVWAQALQLYRDGEPWWLSREEERQLAEVNKDFEPSNKFEDLILCAFDFSSYNHESPYNVPMTTMEVLQACGVLNPPPGECISASNVLRKLTGYPSKRVGKECKRVYMMPPKIYKGQ